MRLQGASQTDLILTVPISTAIICFALVIAFSDFVRRSTWIIYKYLFTLTTIKLGVYDKVYLGLDSKTRSLVRSMEFRITKLKEDIMAARQRREDSGEVVPGPGADNRASVSSSRYRPRSRQRDTGVLENEGRNVVIQMEEIGAAKPPAAK